MPYVLACHVPSCRYAQCIQAHNAHSQPHASATAGSSAGGAASCGGANSKRNGVDAVTSCMTAVCIGQQQQQATSEAGTSSSSESEEESISPEVATLAELCPPGMHPAFLSSLINSCGGLQAAVEWVLEEGAGRHWH